LFSQIPSIAQLSLVIDQTSHQIDWLDGSSITRLPAELDFNAFGQPLIIFQAQIDSPLLAYSGAGLHAGVFFDFSQDRTTIAGIMLGTTTPPGAGAIFSGTPEGPAIPTFSLGDWSRFASLNAGEYTLDPLGPWNGGIHVTVVPEPATYLLWLISLGLVVIWRACPLRGCR